MVKALFFRYRYISYLLFILPGFALWFVFAIVPNIEVYYLAFFKWDGISKTKTFVLFENFKNLFANPRFISDIRNTIIYVAALLIMQTVAGLLLSLILSRDTKSNRFFRTLFFSPMVLSMTIVALVWGYMYDPNMGIINSFLQNMKLKGLDWLGTPVLAVVCVVVVHIWQNMGYAITLMIAGLQTIPSQLYEAASVEGAGNRTTFWKITMPMLMPTLLRIIMLTIVTGAMAFDYSYAIGSGGTNMQNEFETLSVFMVKALGVGTNVGLPSAIAFVLGIIILMIFLVQFTVTKKVEDSIS